MTQWKAFSFYMPNALPEVVELQKQVFRVLGEPLEQVQDTCSHGEFLTRTLRSELDHVAAVVFFDLDCIPLKRGVVGKAVRAALRGNMIIGCAQQADHLEIQKALDRRKSWSAVRRTCDRAWVRLKRLLGMEPFHFQDPLIYAGPCFLVVPTHLYRSVGQPSLEPSSRTDVAGELTIACHDHGVRVHCLVPTHCHVPKYKLGNTKRYGLGTTYGRCVFHAFETTYLTNSQSKSLFKTHCQDVIREQTGHGAREAQPLAER